MCGIAGGTGDQGEWIDRAVQSLHHRGPDRSAVHRDRSIQLGHARLAVIDLSTGADQPMASDDRSLLIVYNGEFYNFELCRAALEAEGHRFKTKGDTEVLLKLYELEREACLARVRGMFAFAIWDSQRQRLFLARDRIGEKPLYYTLLPDGNILFGSEIKALLCHPGVRRALDPIALDQYLTYLYVPPPRTMFQGISTLLPGQTITWEAGKCRVDRYWQLPPEEYDTESAALEGQILALLRKSVRQTLIADVPLGVFLSGGIDSATLVALAAEYVPRLKTFTVTFDTEGTQYDERVPAKLVADHFGTDHRELQLSGNVVDLLPTVVRHFDQPFGNPTALLTYQLSKEARRYVTVAIGGDGGDELFGGYPRYQGIGIAERYTSVPVALRRGIGFVSRGLPESKTGHPTLRRAREFLATSTEALEDQYLAWVGYFDDRLKHDLYREPLRAVLGEHDAGCFLKTLLKVPGPEFVDRAMRCDLQSFLPYNVLEYGDKMTMAHGLEMRLPFLDADLVSLMVRTPARIKLAGGVPKALLKTIMADHLPTATIKRRKMGFNPPMGVWVERQLKNQVDDYLGETQVRIRGYFTPSCIRAMIAHHKAGRRDYSLHLWALLVLEEWHRQYLD